MYQYYLGVDLHKHRSYVVLMDAEGNIQEQRRLGNDEMSNYIAQLPNKTLAVLETTSNWSFMYDLLATQVERVVLVHPKQVRAIAAARVKNDRLDTTTLAHLARTNLLPTSYAAPPDIRALREMVRHRAKLVRERIRNKNRIHRVLSIYNLQSPCTDLFGKCGRAFLERITHKHGRKTARVALARKMLSIIFYMLQRNEPYREVYQLS